MISFPNCKINLGLNIVEKRNDGYHNIETIFYPINIKDALEIIINNETNDEVLFTSTGLNIEGSIENNLCVKAYNLLKKDFDLPKIKMHLHKQIPMGAGLGGGSADGAFALQLLNKKFSLNISNEKLIEYALQLGSDCPFFIINQPCFATSRGELLQPLNLDLSKYKILIVNPKIHVSTSEAFANISLTKSIKSLQEIIQQPIETWKNEMVNDFEQSVFNLHPTIAEIKNTMYKHGAIYYSMTGTGSTVYGIFDSVVNTASIEFDDNFLVMWG